MDAAKYLEEWPGVKQILKMTRTREINGITTTEVVYGITSLSSVDANYQKIMNIWSNHWHIENKLHWVRDMVFGEDRCSIRKAIYTTNIIESVNRQIRKIIKSKGCFPNDEAVFKLVFLALQNAQKKWTMPIRDWKLALN